MPISLKTSNWATPKPHSFGGMTISAGIRAPESYRTVTLTRYQGRLARKFAQIGRRYNDYDHILPGTSRFRGSCCHEFISIRADADHTPLMDRNEFAGVLSHLWCPQRPAQIIGRLLLIMVQMNGFQVFSSYEAK
jgi:hypothetical protein